MAATVEVVVETASAGQGRHRVDFLIPSPMRGSGGHRTAVSAGEALARGGFEVHLHFQRDDGGATTEAEVRRQAADWHGADACAVHADWPAELPTTDAVIGTTWQSAVEVARLPTSGTRMHFVQDYEAWFHAMGDAHLAALGVHDLGLRSVVIGNWLQVQLWRQHELPTWTVPFTADLGVYRAGAPSVARRPGMVVAMYQPDKPRRCGNLMRAALRAVLEADPEVQVITLGSPHSPSLGERHRHAGLVTKEELAAIYAEATVGLSISSSNPSRVPFEMMAAGLPVVELGVENNVYDLPDDGCLLAHPDPASLASAMLSILNDPRLRSRLSAGGLRFMADRPAAAEGDAFAAAVKSAIAGASPPELMPGRQYVGSLVTERQRAAWDGLGLTERDGDIFIDDLTQQLRVNDELNRVNHVLADENKRLIAEAARLRWAMRHPVRFLVDRIAATRRGR